MYLSSCGSKTPVVETSIGAIKERRINCETQQLQAADSRDDLNLCPSGHGHSAFSQPDLSALLGTCIEWKIRMDFCEDACKTFADDY